VKRRWTNGEMRRAPRGTCFGLALLSVVILSAALGSAATATTPATVKVAVKSEWTVVGLRPDGTTVTFLLKAIGEGSDPSSLAAGGRIEGSNGAISEWSGTCTVSGDVVTLIGSITDSNNALLVGSAIELIGDASTNDVTFVFGPLAGGPFAGQTIDAAGPGKVAIAFG
jgi:hypothetical protein